MGRDSVCIVDGDPAVRDSLSTLLDLNGYHVETFSTGSAFLRQLKSGIRMQCVVCEADLPDTSGVRIFEKVQALPDSIPFALLVSRRNPSIVKTAHKAGIEQVFLKPLVHRHLIEFISDHTH
ncbi:MAG: response regulator [Pseudomonadales bacterium]